MTRVVISLVLFATALTPTRAQSQATATTSAPITDVRYEVTFDATTALNRSIGVAMTFVTTGTEPVVLSLPAWTPGAYEISNFARKVSNFSVTSGERPIQWDKVDYDTWRLFPTAAQPVTVRFDFQADTLDNAMAWSTPDFVLFNGTNVFLYAEGQSFDFSAQLTIHTEPDWLVATGMTSTGTREYTAQDFHELVDMPVFVGRMDVDSAEIDGKWHRLATYPAGAMTGGGREMLWSQIRQIMPPMHAVFGETPWETYTTLLIFDEDYPGGSALEHRNSHVGIYVPGFIGSPVLASITAHEIFHAWNVKRLRPAEMVPYDYSSPQPTTLLWMSEGITDYYADLALVRGGVLPAPIFYQVTVGKVDGVANTPPVALEDASLSTWIGPVDGTRYSYYDKGSLAGLLLDIMIRDASNNRASLDDVMRELYESTYKAGTGFTAEQWWDAVSRAAGGRSFEEFSKRYVDGRDEYPLARTLSLAGLSFVADTSVVPWLGISFSSDSAGIRVQSVVPRLSASDAGVRVGDYLLRVGDVEVTAANFGREFQNRYATTAEGSPLEYVVRRHMDTVTLTGELRLTEQINYSIQPDRHASSKAVRIREGILQGETQR